MANVFLTSGQTYNAATTGDVIFGTNSAADTVNIFPNVTGLVLDQNIETVQLTGAASDYRYKQSGNQLEVYAADGTTLITTAPLQGDADGTGFQFGSSAVVSAVLSNTGVMTLGGSTVSATTVGAVTPGAGGESTITESVFSLTSSSTDLFSGTADNDIFDATTQNTLQTGDILQDPSTTDSDVLNVLSTQTAAAPRLSNIETVNVVGPFVSVGMALTNVSGTRTLNLNTDLQTGTATVTDANSLNAAAIVAGDNIGTLNVTSLASGTRDTVLVNAGSAATVTITGNATAADTYRIDLAEDATLTLATIANTSVDTFTIDAAGDFTLTSTVDHVGNSHVAAITINAEADTVVTMTDAANQSASAITLAGDDITLVFADGDDISGATNANGPSVTSTAASSTVRITDIATARFLNNVVVDTIEFSADLGGTTTVTVNEDSNVLFSANASNGGAVTLNVDNADGDGNNGTLRVTVSETLTTAASITTGAAVDTIIITAAADETSDTDANGNGFAETNLTVEGLLLDNATTTVLINGSDDLTLTLLTFGTAATTVAATGMTGDLTITNTAGAVASTIALGSGDDTVTAIGAGTATIFGDDGDDAITGGALADLIDGGNGNDTLNGGAGADTILGGAGDDIIDGGAGADRLTGGAGADEFRMANGEDGDTITDFSLTEDTLVLTGAGVDIDLTDVSANRTGSVYDLNGAGTFDVTLTSVTADDLSGAIALGDSANEVAYDIILDTTATIVAGSKDDYIKAGNAGNAQLITTGTGSDTVVVVASTGVTITDFVVGTDQLVLEGAATAALDLTAVTPTTGTYDLGGAHSVTLQNGGSALTVTDLSSMVTLGSSNVVFTFNFAGELVLGNGNDFVALGGAGNASVVSVEDDGGFDTITGFITTEDDLSFDGMTGITATVGTAVAANAAKVADAVSGSVYVFADSRDGTGSEAISTFTTIAADGITAATILADVAAFLNAGLTSAVGEKYVAIINEGVTNNAHIYLVDNIGDATIASEDVTYMGIVTADGPIVAADVA
jgi:Ca2+-binding RTX toxin-like protein